MNVSPCRSTVMPWPESTTISSGNFAPPWETKYAGPDRTAERIGVVAVALPIRDAAGHAAGFALNVLSRHAFCNVVSLDGSCLGRLTLTERMFASLPNEPLG